MSVSPVLLMGVEQPDAFGECPNVARVVMSADVCRDLLAKMDLVREVVQRDPDARTVTFRDRLSHWHIVQPDTVDGTIGDILADASENLVSWDVAPEIVPALPGARRLSHTTLEVRQDAISWTAYAKDSREMYPSVVVSRADVIRCLLIASEPDALPSLVTRYVGEAVEAVLELLETGMQLDGRAGAVHTPPTVTREALLPLLEHANASVRQRAITVLGQSARRPRARSAR